MSEENIIKLVPDSPDIESDPYINPLGKPADYNLSRCLQELKFGRPAKAQHLLDTMIAMAKKAEKEYSTKFDKEIFT